MSFNTKSIKTELIKLVDDTSDVTYTSITKANVLTTSNAYTKTEIDTFLAGETNTGVSWTKAQSDSNYLSATTTYIASTPGNAYSIPYKNNETAFSSTDAFRFYSPQYTFKVGGADNSATNAFYGAIVGGQDNVLPITNQCAILGGSGNTSETGLSNAVVLGGLRQTAVYDNCAHAQTLYIGSATPDTKCIMVKDFVTGLFVNVYVSGGTLVVGAIS